MTRSTYSGVLHRSQAEAHNGILAAIIVVLKQSLVLFPIRGNSTNMKENTVPGSRAFAAHSSPKLIPPASAVPNQPSVAVSKISAAYAA